MKKKHLIDPSPLILVVVSQLTINSLYSATVGILPQLIFFFCSAVAGIALVLSFFIKLLPKGSSHTV
jgi:hypothetical protein